MCSRLKSRRGLGHRPAAVLCGEEHVIDKRFDRFVSLYIGWNSSSGTVILCQFINHIIINHISVCVTRSVVISSGD